MTYKFFHSTILLALIMLALTYISCKEDSDNPGPEENRVNVKLSYQVDGETLHFDTLNYQNAAGNKFSVTRLQYYISDVVFIRDNENETLKQGVHYVDARHHDNNKITFQNIPKGSYSGLRLKIGLTPEKNVLNGLPSTQDNVNMIWPPMMGGGYHFIKLEGHFTNGASPSGYAVHLGTDTALVMVEIQGNFEIGDVTDLNLAMNINQWFEDPNTYNLADGNYTMGDVEAMTAIAQNGNNIFTLIID